MPVGVKEIKDFAAEARVTKGADVVLVVKEVLGVKNFFSFGELLLVPSVQEVSSVLLFSISLYVQNISNQYRRH
jgi:hypothetical protein